MSRKLSDGLGAKVDQAKKKLAYDDKVDAAQQKLKRKRVPKSFTLATGNVEWIEQKAMELSLSRKERITASSLLNAIIDELVSKNEDFEKLKFNK